jgi:hypothetical protein
MEIEVVRVSSNAAIAAKVLAETTERTARTLPDRGWGHTGPAGIWIGREVRVDRALGKTGEYVALISAYGTVSASGACARARQVAACGL